ncbi:unnamed protein product [Owenia fusiformis]|uniref:Uncharacterized protein n=1 Tax=Owenia fusiformis TaxID=6347 RepID=A0A8J1XVR7_OWEFU|nr:unnamed protein product [Owenia fusiformis]
MPTNMKRRSRSLSPKNIAREHKLETASAPTSPRPIKRVKIRRNFYLESNLSQQNITESVNSEKPNLEDENEHATARIKIEPFVSKWNSEHIEVIDISDSLADCESIEENHHHCDVEHSDVRSEVNQNPANINDGTHAETKGLKKTGVEENSLTYNKVLNWLIDSQTDEANVGLCPVEVEDTKVSHRELQVASQQSIESSSQTYQTTKELSENDVPHKAPTGCGKILSCLSPIGTHSHMGTQDENRTHLDPSTYGSHGNIRASVQTTSHIKRVSSEPVLANPLINYKVIQKVDRKQPTSIFQRKVNLCAEAGGSTQSVKKPPTTNNEATIAKVSLQNDSINESSRLEYEKSNCTLTPVAATSQANTHKLYDNCSTNLKAKNIFKQHSSVKANERYMDLIQRSAVDDTLQHLGALYEPRLDQCGVQIKNKTYDLHLVRMTPNCAIFIPGSEGRIASNCSVPKSGQHQNVTPLNSNQTMQQVFPKNVLNNVCVRPVAGHALAQFKHGQLTLSPLIPHIPPQSQVAPQISLSQQQFNANRSAIQSGFITSVNHLIPRIHSLHHNSIPNGVPPQPFADCSIQSLMQQQINQVGSPRVSNHLSCESVVNHNPKVQPAKNILNLDQSPAENMANLRSIVVTPKEVNPVQHIMDLAKSNIIGKGSSIFSRTNPKTSISEGPTSDSILDNYEEDNMITACEDHDSCHQKPTETHEEHNPPPGHLNLTGTDPRLQGSRPLVLTGKTELEIIHKQSWLDPKGGVLHTPINCAENEYEVEVHDEWEDDDTGAVLINELIENNNWYDAVDAVYYASELCTFTSVIEQSSLLINDMFVSTNQEVNKKKIEISSPKVAKNTRSKPKRKVTIPNEERSSTLQYTYVVARETKAILRQESFKLKTSFDDSNSKEVIRNNISKVFGEDSITHDGVEICWLLDDMTYKVTDEVHQSTAEQDGHDDERTKDFEVELADLTIIDSDKTQQNKKSERPAKPQVAKGGQSRNQEKKQQVVKMSVMKSHVLTRSRTKKRSYRNGGFQWDEWGWIHTSPTALNRMKHKAIESANKTVPQPHQNKETNKNKKPSGKRKFNLGASAGATRLAGMSYLQPTTKKTFYVDQEKTYKELGLHKSHPREHKIPRKEPDVSEPDNNQHVTRSGTVYKFKREKEIEEFDIPECIVLSSDASEDENCENFSIDTPDKDETPLTLVPPCIQRSGYKISDGDNATDNDADILIVPHSPKEVMTDLESENLGKAKTQNVTDEVPCESESTVVRFESDAEHPNKDSEVSDGNRDSENTSPIKDINLEEPSNQLKEQTNINVESGILTQNESDEKEPAIQKETEAVLDSMLNHMEFLTQVKRGIHILKPPKQKPSSEQKEKRMSDFIDDSGPCHRSAKSNINHNREKGTSNKRSKRNLAKKCFCEKSPRITIKKLESKNMPFLNGTSNSNKTKKITKSNDPSKAKPGLVRFKTITKEENVKSRVHHCVFCKRFSSKIRRDVREHTLKDHRFRCYRCKIVFPNEVKKRKHMEVHIKEKHYCLQCQQEFSTKGGYRRHILGRLHVIVERAQHMAIDVVYKACTGNTIEARQIASKHQLDISSLVGGSVEPAETIVRTAQQSSSSDRQTGTSDQDNAPPMSTIKHHYHNNPMLETLLNQLENFEKSDIIQFFKSRRSDIFEQKTNKDDADKDDKKDDDANKDDKNDDNANKDDKNDGSKKPMNNEANDEQLDTSDVLYQLCQEIGIFDNHEELESMVDNELLHADCAETRDENLCESAEELPCTCTTEKDGTCQPLHPFPNVTVEQCKNVSPSANYVENEIRSNNNHVIPDCPDSNNIAELYCEQIPSVIDAENDTTPDCHDLNNNEIISPGETESKNSRCNNENCTSLSNIQSDKICNNPNESACTLSMSKEPCSVMTTSSQELPNRDEDVNHDRDSTYTKEATFGMHDDFFASFLQDIASLPDDLLYQGNGDIHNGEITSELEQLNSLTSELGEPVKDIPQTISEVIRQDTNEIFADISESTITQSTPQAILDAVSVLNNR